jgi:hypothetical protein
MLTMDVCMLWWVWLARADEYNTQDADEWNSQRIVRRSERNPGNAGERDSDYDRMSSFAAWGETQDVFDPVYRLIRLHSGRFLRHRRAVVTKPLHCSLLGY